MPIVARKQIYSKEDKDQIMFFCISQNAFNKLKGYDETIFYFEDEDFSNRFYSAGFKTGFIKNIYQYFELPSDWSGFVRQSKWIAKGLNTIPDKKKKREAKIIWFAKCLFLISPLIFLFKPIIAFYIFIATIFISYIGLVFRNKKPILSLIALPFLYLKTFLVSWNILRFWK